MPQASRLEEELKNSFNDITIKLIASSGGDFRVIVNKELIFDKLALDNPTFPKDGQIVQRIKQL